MSPRPLPAIVLEGLQEICGRRTLSHVGSLASGIVAASLVAVVRSAEASGGKLASSSTASPEVAPSAARSSGETSGDPPPQAASELRRIQGATRIGSDHTAGALLFGLIHIYPSRKDGLHFLRCRRMQTNGPESSSPPST